uniref:Actin-related protein 10 n=1 Tax=Ditylenchus dipsaci TaxID=166011 RepID=A0A915DF46_9BILA
MDRGRKLQKHEADESQEIEKPPPDVEIPFDVETLILPGYAREAAAEVLFMDGGTDNRSIAQIILDIIVQVPIDLRRVFLSNLLLVGGISRMPGLMSRVKEELLRLIFTDYRSKLSTLQDIAFYRFEKDICVQLFCAWLGGNMFGTLDVIESRSLSLEEWKAMSAKSVPDWTSKIDDYFKTLEPKER